ncbi:uncharacterized protein A4U43_C01F11990 [Asparagus officinalis]|uniref:non-specific serine/threonine protein kinase n=1 Tax=Asparagus officinalis TaxID=4686 RepID=A0A5P1FPI2_ASPOF|nr:uncharacterized protein A4U43_C01F11990 [Asparagus officinalis]
MKQLAKLNLSGNNLTGEILSELVQCSSLESVDLSCNQLSGEIPADITHLHILGTLNLSRNQFTGEIPSEMQRMQSLTTIDLSYNNLSGTIPIQGQFLVFNASSFEGNPALCGAQLHQSSPCISSHAPKSSRNNSAHKNLTLAILIPILFSILALLAIKLHRSWRSKSNSNTWKLTAFQRLNFTVSDVIESVRDDNVIGKGGAGIVYRGSMPSGTDVAIKRLVGRGGGVEDRGFTAEITTLGKIRHRHIVKLLGFVSNRDSNLLLYEYMPNGSLGEMLHEYAYTLSVNEKTDVYSFGVVLLELITGRRPVGSFGDGVDIVQWVRKTTSEINEKSDPAAAVLAVVDRRLSPSPIDTITNLYKVAMRCVEEKSSARPTMREVVHMLSDPTTSPPPDLLVI